MTAVDKLKDLEFRASTHRYFYKNREMISVTQILEAVGISDFTHVSNDVLENAQHIGNVVHEIAQLYGAGALDEESIDLEFNGYLEAIKLFFKERVKKVIDIEARMFNAHFGFAGTCDIVYQSFDDLIYLDDYKTAKEALPAAKLQTSAYKEGYSRLYKTKIDCRGGVHLRADGTYHRLPYNDKEDFHTFVKAAGVAQFKIRNKIKIRS